MHIQTNAHNSIFIYSQDGSVNLQIEEHDGKLIIILDKEHTINKETTNQNHIVLSTIGKVVKSIKV